jgi:myo-inositol-1-phosphate synthase
MSKIKIAIVGVGNCVSSLIQGIHYYLDKNPEDAIGLMHYEINGYKPGDIEVVAAFDVDQRKVGLDVHEAIFSKPNCTTIFYPELPQSGVTVRMGNILDGVADHMKDYPDNQTFILSGESEPTAAEIIKVLKESGAQILTNYLPVGSEEATRFYVNCALEAGVAFINNIPVFIASDPAWAKRLSDENIHVGPSDYVPWQKDNKVCFIRMEGKLFGDVPMNLEMRLSVEDSPNSAGVAIDAIRCAKLALDRGHGGVLQAPSAYFCKHPARQFTDDEAFTMIEDFINEE